MLADPLPLSNVADGTVNYAVLADGTRVASRSLPGLPETLSIRHSSVKADKKLNRKASHRANAKMVIPVKDSVTGEIDEVRINYTIEFTNSNNNQNKVTRVLTGLIMTSSLFDSTNESRRDQILSGQG